MPRLISCVLVGVMLLGLTGCSNGVPQEEYDKVVSERDALLEQIGEMGGAPVSPSEVIANKVDVEDNSGEFEAESVLSKLDVSQFSYSTDYWNYAFLVIKNNSEYNLDITANVTFYNEAGELVGAKSTSQEAVESGYDTILYFMPDEAFVTMEYELEVSEEEWYDCVQSDLSYESTEAKDKIILSVTNDGDEAAKFVEASVLFLNGENVVGFSQNYITDDDSELKPGKTIMQEMDCYEDFDSYQVFFSGRR